MDTVIVDPKEYKGLPKLYKPSVVLWAILPAIGSFNHEAPKQITENLTFLREHATNLKDSFTFVSKIKDKCL